MPEDEAFIARVVTALEQALERRERIDAGTHRAHHVFIAELIERQRRRRELRERLVQHVLGWGVVALIVGLVTILGRGARELLKSWYTGG